MNKLNILSLSDEDREIIYTALSMVKGVIENNESKSFSSFINVDDDVWSVNVYKATKKNKL